MNDTSHTPPSVTANVSAKRVDKGVQIIVTGDIMGSEADAEELKWRLVGDYSQLTEEQKRSHSIDIEVKSDTHRTFEFKGLFSSIAEVQEFLVRMDKQHIDAKEDEYFFDVTLNEDAYPKPEIEVPAKTEKKRVKPPKSKGGSNEIS